MCSLCPHAAAWARVELQANSLAAAMAAKTGATYRLLHVPDRLHPEALQTLLKEPQVQDVLSLLRDTRIVLHGIGDALAMARRRNYSEEELADLAEAGAVSESFGYYFNEAGEIVHRMPTIGLQLEEVHKAETVLSIAGAKARQKRFFPLPNNRVRMYSLRMKGLQEPCCPHDCNGRKLIVCLWRRLCPSWR